MNMYKTQQHVASLDEVKEVLKKRLGNKYPMEVNKADSGAKKYLTGNTYDSINLKKNGYHGLMVILVPPTAGMDYSVIQLVPYTPNMVIRYITQNAGILDSLIFKAIWGSGKEFYGDLHNLVLEEFEAKQVDNGFMNSVKQMVKGKSVLDE